MDRLTAESKIDHPNRRQADEKWAANPRLILLESSPTRSKEKKSRAASLQSTNGLIFRSLGSSPKSRQFQIERGQGNVSNDALKLR